MTKTKDQISTKTVKEKLVTELVSLSVLTNLQDFSAPRPPRQVL